MAFKLFSVKAFIPICVLHFVIMEIHFFISDNFLITKQFLKLEPEMLFLFKICKKDAVVSYCNKEVVLAAKSLCISKINNQNPKLHIYKNKHK